MTCNWLQNALSLDLQIHKTNTNTNINVNCESPFVWYVESLVFIGLWALINQSRASSIIIDRFIPENGSKSGLQIRVRIGQLFSLFLIQNICCGCSKEASQWDGSFEHPKHMLKLMGKKIIAICTQIKCPYLDLWVIYSQYSQIFNTSSRLKKS